jgi:hypothetical protein
MGTQGHDAERQARAEFGLTQDEIIAAIRAGKLQYRRAAMHGSPWLRLLRREVEDLVSTRHGLPSARPCRAPRGGLTMSNTSGNSRREPS